MTSFRGQRPCLRHAATCKPANTLPRTTPTTPPHSLQHELRTARYCSRVLERCRPHIKGEADLATQKRRCWSIICNRCTFARGHSSSPCRWDGGCIVPPPTAATAHTTSARTCHAVNEASTARCSTCTRFRVFGWHAALPSPRNTCIQGPLFEPGTRHCTSLTPTAEKPSLLELQDRQPRVYAVPLAAVPGTLLRPRPPTSGPRFLSPHKHGASPEAGEDPK